MTKDTESGALAGYLVETDAPAIRSRRRATLHAHATLTTRDHAAASSRT